MFDEVRGRWSHPRYNEAMLKVLRSKSRKAVLLELSGTIGASETKRAAAELAGALRDIGHGYTLIEVFRGTSKFSQKALQIVAILARTCYDRSRIWRVVRLAVDGGHDPGLRILHVTRWGRRVPEVEHESIRDALVVAAEELEDNAHWAAV